VRELIPFCLVGASCYVVNVVVFQCFRSAGVHLAVATLGFLVAVASNFLLGRRWTTGGATATAKRVQAPRFFAVSVAAFLLGLGVLEALVEIRDAPVLFARACAIVVVASVRFGGQKLW
jgi:putative flippase GtrA